MDQTIIRTKLDQVKDLLDRGFIYFDYEQILEFHYRHWVRPGDTVIDIGAHQGRHLGPLINCIGNAGTAIAFEPIPFAYRELSKKFTLPNVQLMNIALSNNSGTSDFTFAEGSPEESGLIQREFNSPKTANPTKIQVQVGMLDNYTNHLSSISFIKIDVEGGEINCLNGASTTITRFRPVISVEYGDLAYKAYGNTADTLFEFASENNYTIYDILLNRLENLEQWRAAVNYIYWDFILVPVEKISQFETQVVALPTVKLPDPRPQTSSTSECIDPAKLTRTQEELEACRSQLNSVLDSTSWKITAPIRKILGALRRGRAA